MTTSKVIAALMFAVSGCTISLPAPAPVAARSADRPSYAGYCAVAAERAGGRARWRYPASRALLGAGAAGLVLSPVVAARRDSETLGLATAMVAAAAGAAGYLLSRAAERDAAAAGGFAACVGIDDDALALAVARSVYQRWLDAELGAPELVREIAELTASMPPAQVAPEPPPEPPLDDAAGLLEAKGDRGSRRGLARFGR